MPATGPEPPDLRSRLGEAGAAARQAYLAWRDAVGDRDGLIIEAHLQYGMRIHEIADAADISPTAVQTAVRDARRRAREHPPEPGDRSTQQ